MNLEKLERPTIWNGIFCSYNNWLVGYLFDCLVDLRAIEVFFFPCDKNCAVFDPVVYVVQCKFTYVAMSIYCDSLW